MLPPDPSSDCRGNPSTDWNCCSDAFPCLEGQGDCDEDSQCEGNLVCGPDNCLRDFSTSSSNWLTGADCCTSGNYRPIINATIRSGFFTRISSHFEYILLFFWNRFYYRCSYRNHYRYSCSNDNPIWVYTKCNN